MNGYCGALEVGPPQATRAHAAWPGGEPLLTSSVSTCTEPGLVVPQQHANLLQQRQSAASNPESAASNPGAVVCQVAGCMADLTHCKSYCIKKRACVKHMQADVVYLSAADTTPWRFCQQCGKFEPIHKFDDAKRSCRTRLAKRRSGTRAQLLKRGCSIRSPGTSEMAAVESAPLPTILLPGEDAACWRDAFSSRPAPVRVHHSNSINSSPFGGQQQQQQQWQRLQEPSLSDGPPPGGASPTLLSASAQQSLSAPLLKLPSAMLGMTNVRLLEPVEPYTGLFIGGDGDDDGDNEGDDDGQLAGLSLLEALQRQAGELEPQQPAHDAALWTQASGVPGSGAFACQHLGGLGGRCASDGLLPRTCSGSSGDSAGPLLGLCGDGAKSFTGCSLPLSKLHLDNEPASPRLLPDSGSCTHSLVAAAALGGGVPVLQTSITPLGPAPLQAPGPTPQWPPVKQEVVQPRQLEYQLQPQSAMQPATSDPNSNGSGSSGNDSSNSGSGRLKWLLQQVHDEVQRGGGTNVLDGLNSAELVTLLHVAQTAAGSQTAAGAASVGTNNTTPCGLAEHAARMHQLQQQLQQLKQQLAASGDVRSTGTSTSTAGASGAVGWNAEQQLMLLEAHLHEAAVTMAALQAQQHAGG